MNLTEHKTLKRQHSEVRSLLSEEMQESFDLLIKESEKGDMLNEEKYSNGLDHSDRKVSFFFFS